MADLMMDFESIGGNCEFGLVQRYCGAEPLGLLRFTGAAIDNLVTLLEGGLEDFLSPDDIEIDVHGREREYLINSRRFGDFFSHTHTFAGRNEEAEVVAREIKKVAYLKRRFEIDWRDAARVYVHSGCEDEATILRLHAALRARSNCVLLWVTKARTPEERGRVEVRAPGLLRGFPAHHGSFDEEGLRFDLPGWARVCRAADAIVRGHPEPPPSPPDVIDAEFVWSPAICGALEAGPTRGRCRLLHATTRRAAVGKLMISSRLPDKSIVVVSVWVRIPAAFQGTNLVLMTEATMLNFRPADLWRRETWQQVWVVAKIVEPRDALQFSFYVEATKGSEFAFGGWQLEKGGIPHEGLRPGEAERLDGLAWTTPKPDPLRQIRRWTARALAQAASRVEPLERPTVSAVDGITGDALLRAADTFLKAELFDEAEGLLRAGKYLFPSRAELFTHYALCAHQRGDLAEAAARWSDVVDLFPQFALGHYRLAQTLRERNEVGRALAVIETALPRHPDDVGMVSEAARVYAAARRWPEAVAQWDRAITIAGDNPGWRESRAIAASAAAFLSRGKDHRPVPSS